MARRIALGLGATILLMAGVARAEGEQTGVAHAEGDQIESPWTTPHPSVGAGLEANRIFCSGCASGIDNPGYLGLFLEPSYRTSRMVSVGAVGSYAIRPGSQGIEGGGFGIVEHQSLWRASGEVRLHGTGRRTDIWFGMELGFSGAYHSINRYGSVSNPGYVSGWQNGPLFGFGGGVDWRASRNFALGGGARMLFFMFSNDRTVGTIDVFQGSQPSLGLDLSASFDFLAPAPIETANAQ